MVTSLLEYYDHLITLIRSEVDRTPREKPHAFETERRLACQQISNLLESHQSFSFLRLGDMELAYLLAHQNQFIPDSSDTRSSLVSSIHAHGAPGIGGSNLEQLWKAFEQADYVDFHEMLWVNAELLPHLKLQRKQGSYKNSGESTSQIILTWLEYEFSRFATEKRILIAGAEAGILENLFKTPEYHTASSDFWPKDLFVRFHQIRNNGENLDRDLNLIKEDLTRDLLTNNIDVLLLALGGGAKILCYELARELNIRAIDFGGCLRALTYSGSDGNRSCRSTHNPFLFRVPFSVYMDALEKAFPQMPDHILLAKAHAQLLLELQKKEVGWTYCSDSLWPAMYDPSLENLQAFKIGLAEYEERYSHLFHTNKATRLQRQLFLEWCAEHKLVRFATPRLRYYRGKRYIKGLAKSLLTSVNNIPAKITAGDAV